MKCFSFPPRPQSKRRHVPSALSLFFISYLNFQQKAQIVLILIRDTLASNRSQRTASRRRWCWWVLQNNGPLLGASYPKSGERFIGKKLFESLPIDQLDYLCWAPQCVLLVFVRFLVRAYYTSIFLHKHAVDMLLYTLFQNGRHFSIFCLLAN